MVRLYDKKVILSDDLEVAIAPEQITMGGDLWDKCKKCFKQYISNDAADIRMLPVINDESKKVICYAYQDNEANRELRMLKELENNNEALQFKDIFPEIQEVVIYGCNELAYRFVKYLEKQQITVKTAGKHWSSFGYEEDGELDACDSYGLVVYAEGMMFGGTGLYQTVIRSASAEFECIDRIYEENVLEEKIKDTKGNIEELLEKLRGKEVIILGTDISAQDTYDFLYEHGIDICYFAEWKNEANKNTPRNLLGKKVVGIEESINSKADAIFISSGDKNSALGTADVEFFDYYGYERNGQFFLLPDYTEVPCTNLLHVLKGKRVLFAGDAQLCAMMLNYLKEIEQGDIDLAYIELAQCVAVKETDILCIINPWFDLAHLTMNENPKVWHFWTMLSREGIISYTDYFAQVRMLVHADLYRNIGKEKYSIKELCPKGILLGRIPYLSGNVFFRGILDGHLDIMKWGYTTLNSNLLLYCIKLAGEKSENILRSFKKMCNEEFAFQFEAEFISWDRFEKSAKVLLSLKESFTSQELFVIFHISYMEMLYGHKMTDLNQKIIYWEPHMFPREEFPFLAQWLEDKQINGQTVFMHRDMLVRAGSLYNFYQTYGVTMDPLAWQPGVYVEEIASDNIVHQQWEEFHVRFEDIKLHPQMELRKICSRLGIQWSDTMLRVTYNGEAWNWNNRGLFDFDIKPVFNKYEEWLSEFDRFRISITNSLYQKRYGYVYEDCLKFSRKELQEMFLKEFRFQKKMRFNKDKAKYFLRIYNVLMNQLWKVRKRLLIDNIVPEFGEVEIGDSITQKQKKTEIADRKELNRLLEFVRKEARLVLYGTGRDCEGLLEHLEEEERSRLVFSDLKAEYMEVSFHDRKVVAPSELCGKYKDYKILITSSKFYENMKQRLEDMGITKDRITCNRFQLWE